MKRVLLLFFCISCLFACSPPVSNVQSSAKRFYIQPIYLSVNEVSRDSSTRRLFEEAFTKHKIELITSEEMRMRGEDEMNRVQRVLLARKDEIKGKSIEVFQKAVSNEQKYVSNMLSIKIEILYGDDSLSTLTATWSNAPFPPNFYNLYKPQKQLVIISPYRGVLKEGIDKIVDSILYANELK